MKEEVVVLTDKIRVTKRTPIATRSEVVLAQSSGSAYAVGNIYEQVGTVLNVSELYVTIQWPTGIRERQPHSVVVALDDFKQWQQENPGANTPKFKINDIVYLKFNRNISPDHEHPQLGTKYETDMKVYEVSKSVFGSHNMYTCISPISGILSFYEDDLIHAKDKPKITYKDYNEYVIKKEAEPFFSVGEVVYVYNKKVHNHDESVIVAETPEFYQYVK